MIKKKLTKEQRQQRNRIRLLSKMENSHRRFNKQNKKETYENQIKWTEENLSPNGGKKPFKVNTDV